MRYLNLNFESWIRIIVKYLTFLISFIILIKDVNNTFNNF